MTDIRDLEDTLTRHERLAPSADGLVEAAYTGARRVRRRRLTAAAMGVAAVVAVGAAAPTVLARDDARRGSSAATKAPVPPAAKPPEVTIDVDGSEGLFALTQGFSGTTALANIRSRNERATGWGGDVGVYAPADVDVAALEAGEAVTVQGHPARYVENYLIDPLANHTGPENGPAPAMSPDALRGPKFLERTDVRGPVVAWREPSGRWVVVSDAGNRAELLRLAEAVRLRPAGTKAPYRLGYVPDTLRLDYGGSSTHTPKESNSVLVFGAATNPVLKRSSLLGLTEQGAMRVQFMASDSGHLGRVAQTGPPEVIAGHDTWYFTTRQTFVSPPENGAVLVARVNGCEVLITVTDNRLAPYPLLRKMLESATFGNCAAPDTWVPPLP
ncbi:hypothetical protein [Embleya sp. NPDC001921]